MQQAFHTRNYSIRDFEEWQKRGELILQPKFQRRDVWSDKARSYLMNTIVRRKTDSQNAHALETSAETRRVLREIVDGQQRLHTVLKFIKNGFKINKSITRTWAATLLRSWTKTLKGTFSNTSSSSIFWKTCRTTRSMIA